MVLTNNVKMISYLEQANMDEARDRENSYIMEIDVGDANGADLWYIVPTKWLEAWHRYIRGGDQPGRITMSILWDMLEQKKSVKRCKHYRGICKATWDYFKENYGTDDKPIVRGKIDIHSPAVERS